MLKTTKMLTKFNHDKGRRRKIDYIVVHWVGAESSALANGMYFQGGDRGASAHYFVDDTHIVKSVREKDVAWAVGSVGYLDQGSPYADFGHKYFSRCNNKNSVSIEMCCKKKNGKLIITDETIKNTADLVQALQKRLNIPDSRVIRHFDVNGKLCPLPYIEPKKWGELHGKLTGTNFKVKAKGNLVVRKTQSLTSKKTRNLIKGHTYTIVEVKGRRGKLKNGDGWITITDKFAEKL